MICNPGERYWVWLAGASAILVVAFLGFMVRGLFFQPEPAKLQVLTEADARAVLEELIAATAEERWADVCGFPGTGGGCVGFRPEVMDASAIESAPAEPPKLLAMFAQGGEGCGRPRDFVFELEGIDGRGQPYRSDVLVAPGYGKPYVLMPVYWLGMRYGGSTCGRLQLQ